MLNLIRNYQCPNFQGLFMQFQVLQLPQIILIQFCAKIAVILMFQSLESLSVQKSLNGSLEGAILNYGLKKSSFELAQIFKESGKQQRRRYKNSLELLYSHLSVNGMNTNAKNLKMGSQLYNEEDRIKIEGTGKRRIQIGLLQSDQEDYSQTPMSKQIKMEQQEEWEGQVFQPYYGPQDVTRFLPQHLAALVQQYQIPFEYLNGLAYLNDQKEVKSIRRMKVQRYLQKRRNKTWNRKICYNCRQKVAQERLRIKGKFIKKRKAKEILGIKGYIPTPQLKDRLEKQLQGKSASEIQKIIKFEQQ